MLLRLPENPFSPLSPSPFQPLAPLFYRFRKTSFGSSWELRECEESETRREERGQQRRAQAEADRRGEKRMM